MDKREKKKVIELKSDKDWKEVEQVAKAK